jgi:ribonuclease BN (tRNA processing enzyme)
MDFKNILSKGYILKGDNIVKLEDVANKIDGLSILYTGDVYKPDFDGIKADVVIHECTFLDEDDEAKTKKHSTLKDVINTKNKVDAKLVILTHISNKYEFQLDKFGNEFVIAKDLQKIFIKKDGNLLKVTVE